MGAGDCAPCWPRGQSWENTSLEFVFFLCPNHAHTVVQNQSTFEKRLHGHPPGPMKPHSRGLFTWQQHQLEPALCWDHPLPPIQFAPFLSSWRWASHCIPPRLELGVRLWNSKAQKVQQGLAFLCLNLPPSTLLPSSDARCSVQGTVGDCQGPNGWGEKEPERGSSGSPERTE